MTRPRNAVGSIRPLRARSIMRVAMISQPFSSPTTALEERLFPIRNDGSWWASAQSASNSNNAPSIAGVSAEFIGAMWPQTDFTTRHSPFGICLASYSASTGGK